MDILIMGGSKFFGKRLVRNLVTDGDKVTVVTRGNCVVPERERINHVVCDRGDTKRLAALLAGQTFDIIYDQICYNADEAFGAIKIFAGKTKRYIFTSSASVYDVGNSIEETAFDPNTFVPDPDAENQYQQGKRAAEQIFAQSSLAIACIRFPIVMGEDDTTERLRFHIHRIASGKEIFLPDPQAMMTYMEAGDAANFLQWVGKETDYCGPLNACSTDPISVGDIIGKIESVIGLQMIRAQRETSENHSPYGVGSHWTLSNRRARQLGYRFKALSDWLPKLISKEAKNLVT